MGRPKGIKNKVAESTKQAGIAVHSDDDTEVPKKTLEQMKDEHVEEKNLKALEKETAYKKRKRKTIEEQEKQAEQLSQGLTLFGGALVDILCVRMPNPKPASEMEKQLFGDALSALANKYAPSLIDFAPEAMFLTAVIAIVLPRIKSESSEDTQKVVDDVLKAKEAGIGLTESGTQSDVDNGKDRER
jgi:hypothetical protein